MFPQTSETPVNVSRNVNGYWQRSNVNDVFKNETVEKMIWETISDNDLEFFSYL